MNTRWLCKLGFHKWEYHLTEYRCGAYHWDRYCLRCEKWEEVFYDSGGEKG